MTFQMTNDEIKQLTEILINLEGFRRPHNRYDTVEGWLNDSPRRRDLIMILNLEGAPHVAAQRVIQKLLEFGQDFAGHEALEWLVQGMLASPELGVEKRPFLEQLSLKLKGKSTPGQTAVFKSPAQPSFPNQAVLREQMMTALDLKELQNIVFDMEIDYETLEGSTKDDKVRALIALAQRHNRLAELIRQCERTNPHVTWR